MAVILDMLFFIFYNTDILFAEQELAWKLYILAKALPTTMQVQIISWKEFAATTLDPGKEVFTVHIAFPGLKTKMSIYLAWKAQIAFLLTKKVIILTKYLDYTDIFSKKSASELPQWSNINWHAINLESSKQIPYGQIYSLGPIELETLKTYFKTNLANSFICSSQSPAKAPIWFI